MKKRLISVFLLSLIFLASCNLPLVQDSDGIDLNPFDQNTPKPSPTPTITPTPQPEARITLGEKDILSGDYDAALNEFWQARSQSTDPEIIAAAQLGVGRILLLQSDYLGAVDQLTWLLTNFSDGETRNRAYFFIAKAYEGLGEYRLAADAYQNYLNTLPGPLNSEILEMQGDALMQAGDYAAAKNSYLQAVEKALPETVEPLSIKVAQAASAAGDDADAISRYLALYESSTTDYIKAQVNLLLGQIYLRLEMPEQAYARFQDSVIQYPIYYDTFSGLIALVEANQPVDSLMRGIVDYYAGSYGQAVSAFDNYMAQHPDHDGTPHYYKALSLWMMGDYTGEIAEWDKLIDGHPTDQYLAQAYLEKSSSQWRYLEDYESASSTLLHYVARYPDAPKSAYYLYTAGNIYEIGGYLTKAIETWQRVFNEYPAAEESYNAMFKSGIATYRLQNYQDAQIIFQRLLVLATTTEEQAATNFWVAKCLEKQTKNDEALTYYQQAAAADPMGYYSIRAEEILTGENPFPVSQFTDLSIDLEGTREDADEWLRSTFDVDAGVNLESIAELANNPSFQRGETYWQLGMRDEARTEFEDLRNELKGDAVNTYRLMNHVLGLGFYQTAALASRQILDMAGLSPTTMLDSAPKYLSYIRYGIFYRDIVIAAANEHKIDPLLLFSIIRQESLFDASIASTAGARGLMQITEDTGEYIVSNFNWPDHYAASDLDRPYVNIRLGAHYLKMWIDKYNGSIPAALSSYNAGDGNNLVWWELAGGDTDLLLEIIRFDETCDYIRYIAENYAVYKLLYTHP